MLKTALLTATCAALLAAIPSFAFAESIKAQLTPDQLATVCGGAPVDSVNTITLTLGDGSSLTGTVHCESQDVASTTGTTTDDSTDKVETGDDNSTSSTLSGTNSEGGDDNKGAPASISSSSSNSNSGESGQSGSGEHKSDGDN